MAKRIVICFFLAALVLLAALPRSAQPYPASSPEAVAQPYRFAVSRWEASHLLGSLFRVPHTVAQISVSAQVQLVRSYFQQAGDVRWLRLQLEIGNLSASDLRYVKDELQVLEEGQSLREGEVMAVLEDQMMEAFKEHGLYTSLFWGNVSLLFPPARFELQPLPLVLIVSPRDRIVPIYTDLLKPEITPAEIEVVEEQLARLGYSGLVEHLGGLATYPSLLPDTMSLEGALSTIAHEWAHQFLFFYPLGRLYRNSYEMTIINETTADIIGNEIGDYLYRLYRVEGGSGGGEQPPQASPQASSEPPFDFNKAMRETRLTVDRLLAEGKIDEAEQYMEKQRLYINAQGYWIRKLNQAYFAFHGSYGEGPAASSPIGGQLRELREQSPSLGGFVRSVAGISSYEEFQRLLVERGITPPLS